MQLCWAVMYYYCIHSKNSCVTFFWKNSVNIGCFRLHAATTSTGFSFKKLHGSLVSFCCRSHTTSPVRQSKKKMQAWRVRGERRGPGAKITGTASKSEDACVADVPSPSCLDLEKPHHTKAQVRMRIFLA